MEFLIKTNKGTGGWGKRTLGPCGLVSVVELLLLGRIDFHNLACSSEHEFWIPLIEHLELIEQGGPHGLQGMHSWRCDNEGVWYQVKRTDIKPYRKAISKLQRKNKSNSTRFYKFISDRCEKKHGRLYRRKRDAKRHRISKKKRQRLERHLKQQELRLLIQPLLEKLKLQVRGGPTTSHPRNKQIKLAIWLLRGPEVQGPYSYEEIKKHQKEGAIRESDLACHKGMDEWVNVKELLKRLAPGSG